jgi:hypothetical protein
LRHPSPWIVVHRDHGKPWAYDMGWEERCSVQSHRSGKTGTRFDRKMNLDTIDYFVEGLDDGMLEIPYLEFTLFARNSVGQDNNNMGES